MPTPIFYSPFSPSKVAKEKNNTILLQFILSEIFTSFFEVQNNHTGEKNYARQLSLYPYDSKRPISALTKLKEHLQLLEFAFPQSKDEVFAIQECFDKCSKNLTSSSKGKEKKIRSLLSELAILLTPLLVECKNEAGILFYLLSHKKEYCNVTSPEQFLLLIQALNPNGSNQLRTMLSSHFEQKGFVCFLPKIAALIDGLENCHA